MKDNPLCYLKVEGILRRGTFSSALILLFLSYPFPAAGPMFPSRFMPTVYEV